MSEYNRYDTFKMKKYVEVEVDVEYVVHMKNPGNVFCHPDSRTPENPAEIEIVGVSLAENESEIISRINEPDLIKEIWEDVEKKEKEDKDDV